MSSPNHSEMKNSNLNRTPEDTCIGDGVGGLTVAGEPLRAIFILKEAQHDKTKGRYMG